jgi:hypothetical protein
MTSQCRQTDFGRIKELNTDWAQMAVTRSDLDEAESHGITILRTAPGSRSAWPAERAMAWIMTEAWKTHRSALGWSPNHDVRLQVSFPLSHIIDLVEVIVRTHNDWGLHRAAHRREAVIASHGPMEESPGA